MHDMVTKKRLRTLLDTGATCNAVGELWAKQKKWPIRGLRKTSSLEVCGGATLRITQQTERRLACRSRNGRVEDNERFLVIPGSEEPPILGKGWIRAHKVIILWGGKILFDNGTAHEYLVPGAASPEPKRTVSVETSPMADQRIFGLRKRIIQGEIQANEAPAWVQQEFPKVLQPWAEDASGLPPHRGELDYKVHTKEGWRPETEPGRRFFKQEEESMFKELARNEEKSGRWVIQKHPTNVAEMLWAIKAGGKKRPCIDYRHLNTGLVDDGFQLPLTKHQLHVLARAKFLTSMDLPKAYNQVLIKDEVTRRLLSFRCAGQVYSPTVMQFGSKTAVAHFQRFITTILGDIVGQGCMVYLDNIVVHGMTQEAHDAVLRKCLRRLEDAHLNIEKTKCEWNKARVQFCGFFVGGGEISLDPEKIRAIQEWPEPSAGQKESLKTQIREFLGFVNFYRDAFDHYSGRVEVLTRLTGKTQEWTWGETEKQAFNDVKKAAIAMPGRKGWNPERRLICHADASDRACAMTYSQEDDQGNLWPIGFWSKKFDSTQSRWPTYDKEFAAIDWGLQAAREWVHCGLSGKECVVYTDHRALIHWAEAKHTKSQRHQRWADRILEFDNLVFRPIAGKDNTAADALSRKDKGGTAKWEPTAIIQHDRIEWEQGTVRTCRKRHTDWVLKMSCHTCQGCAI